MIHPQGSRENARYRGPVESAKATRQGLDISKNLKTLFAKFNDIENKVHDFRGGLRSNNIYSSQVEMGYMNTQINESKDVLSHG